MRLDSISLRGITRFTRAAPVDIDFAALGPGLIAIHGENGEGKTTVMETPVAALYRTLPSRDGWYEYFQGRDAFAEAVFDDHGHEFKARVQVDAERRTTESYLFLDGKPLTTGRAKESEAEVLRRCGSYELFMAAVLGAQKRTGNFLDAPKGERKARFIELLGLARLQALAEAARNRRAGAEYDLAIARSELARATEEAAGLEEAEALAAEAQARQETAAGALATAREEEAAASSALERAKTAGERLATLRAARDAAARAVQQARKALQEALESAQDARRTSDKRREAARQRERDADAQADRADDRHARALKAIDVKRDGLEARLNERPELQAAKDRLPDLERELAQLEEAERVAKDAAVAETRARDALEAAQRRVRDAEAEVARERRRLADEAKLLDRVPCTATDAWLDIGTGAAGPANLAASCQLLKTAQEAKRRGPTLEVATALLSDVKTAQDRLEAAADASLAATMATDLARAVALRMELPDVREKAGRLPALDQARRDLEALAGELERANEERSKDLRAADAVRASAADEITAIDIDLAAALESALERETGARARLAEAQDRATAAEADLSRAQAEALSPSQAEASLSAARETRYGAERALREADKAHAIRTARVEQLRERRAALSPLQEKVTAAEQEVGDWGLLEQALGRDGVQALEIDAAGPEVARLTNELLHACYGTRWSISFETLREKKSAAGEFAEVFDIRVLDEGKERSVEGISGGERVIVGEAIALGLAIFSARRSGIAWRTIFRDETSGALSLANATKYVDMLRRALALGGFHQVVFISHQPEVVERADARLLVADGRVTVEGARERPVQAGAAA
jgi:exonuclease SbcC